MEFIDLNSVNQVRTSFILYLIMFFFEIPGICVVTDMSFECILSINTLLLSQSHAQHNLLSVLQGSLSR